MDTLLKLFLSLLLIWNVYADDDDDSHNLTPLFISHRPVYRHHPHPYSHHVGLDKYNSPKLPPVLRNQPPVATIRGSPVPEDEDKSQPAPPVYYFIPSHVYVPHYNPIAYHAPYNPWNRVFYHTPIYQPFFNPVHIIRQPVKPIQPVGVVPQTVKSDVKKHDPQDQMIVISEFPDEVSSPVVPDPETNLGFREPPEPVIPAGIIQSTAPKFGTSLFVNSKQSAILSAFNNKD